MSAPFDFPQARAASNDASANQKAAEQFLIDTSKRAAEAERAYRVALAQRITTLHAEGKAITACGDLARGDKAVADLKYARDVAEGLREAAAQTAWRASADRKDTLLFCNWSQRRELAEVGAPVNDGAGMPVIGRRAAA